MLKVGDVPPSFTLSGVGLYGEIRDVSLDEFRDKNIILYFYKGDSSIVCTKDACPFRDRLNIITNAMVIGISIDSIRSHVEYKKRCFLNFMLLTDEDHKIADLYGSWDEGSDESLQYTFLLDGDRKIIKIWKDSDNLEI